MSDSESNENTINKDSNNQHSDLKKIVFPKRDPRLKVKLTEGLRSKQPEKVPSEELL